MDNVASFINQYTPLAESVSQKTGVAPHVLLGQWGLETGWGKSVIPGTNNLGNIKDFTGNGTVARDSQTGSTDKYAQFSTPDDFGDHFSGLLTRKYSPALNAGADATAYASALKAGGYAEDPNYVQKIEQASGKVLQVKLDRIGNQIVQALQAGHKPEEVVQSLVNSPTIGGDVHDAIAGGISAERILEKAGGKAYQDYLKTDPTYGMGSTERFAAGAGKKVQDWIDGTKEAYHAATGDEAALAADRANTAERQRLDAPLMNTTAGTFGSMAAGAAPYVVAGMATGGASLPWQIAGQAATGAVDGAITPTTRDGQRTDNAAIGALLAGGGAGAGAVIGKGAGWLTSKVGASPEEASAIAARQAAAEKAGLPYSAGTLTDAGKATMDSLANKPAVQAFRNRVDDALAAKIGEGVAVPGADAVDHNLIQAAKPAIWSDVNNVLDSTHVTLTPELSNSVQAIVAGTENPLTAGIATSSTVRRAAANLLRAQEAAQPVSARDLQALNTELKALASNHTASMGERQAAGQIVSQVNDAINSSLTPEQQAAYALANRQHVNLKAVENMVKASNDSGSVTPRQMLNAVKTGRFRDSFMAGEAPYQDIATTASDLYGPSQGNGLVSQVSKAVGHAPSTLELGYALTHPVAGAALVGKKLVGDLLAKAITSEDPTVIKLMTGTTDIQKKLADPVVRQAIAVALTKAGPVATSSINKNNK